MSVALIITKRNGQADSSIYVPIATQELFVKHWIPLSTELGLQWIPRFETGASFNRHDIPNIAKEFQQLKQHIEETLPNLLADEVATFMISRIDNVLAQLHELEIDTSVDGFIG